LDDRVKENLFITKFCKRKLDAAERKQQYLHYVSVFVRTCLLENFIWVYMCVCLYVFVKQPGYLFSKIGKESRIIFYLQRICRKIDKKKIIDIT
jgi:hypothetical protein